ncbi:MAG: DeoR/GlpR transcriptional regulator [Clostridia bacterium]|nr:DeoR/GlpR transcriptional regulator [Clostridia bacterium]
MKISQEKKILEILETQQYASVEELSAVLYVSTSTIRRSLEILQQKGLVTRTHGGVKINSDNNFSPSFTFRIHQNSFEKKKIALSAIKLIKNGDIIFLDGSTSAFYIAEYLKEFENIRVITNGIDTLSLLSKNKILAYSTGGQVSTENPSVLVGRYAEDMISNFHADIAFFSAQAMDNDGEIYDCFEDEIFLRRAMIKNAKTKVFLCDNTKVGKTSSYHLCSLKDVDYIASNLSLPNSIPPEKCLSL